MNTPENYTISSLKEELVRLFIIGFGIFLFVLFFQPFPLQMLNDNNRLLYVTGFGAITFISTCIVLIIIPLAIAKKYEFSQWESAPSLLLSLLLLALSSTAFAFYIKYVGEVKVELYIMFKIILVCLLPIIILIILYKNRSLERMVEILQEQNKSNLLRLAELDKGIEEEEINIISNNKSEKLTLKQKNIASIKSADNYIEIYYLENGIVEKKLIRNTLKNIELQLAHQRSFIRCHRTSIVNTLYIEKLVRGYDGYSLKMNSLDHNIPVSRQYLLPIKEALS